jgi:hypothetical protein
LATVEAVFFKQPHRVLSAVRSSTDVLGLSGRDAHQGRDPRLEGNVGMHQKSAVGNPSGHTDDGSPELGRAVARTALFLLGCAALYQGIWAQLAPRSFYDDFPGGMSWVAGAGPFNEHLVRDVGGLADGLGVVAILAAWTLSGPLIIANTCGWLIYAVPHLGFHVVHPLDSSGMQALNVLVLTSEILLPIAGLLAVSTTQRRRSASDDPGRHTAAPRLL